MGNKNSHGILFALPSATYAMRAEEILSNQGISSKMVTLNPAMTQKGCSYGIVTDQKLAQKAKRILTDYNIPIKIPYGN